MTQRFASGKPGKNKLQVFDNDCPDLTQEWPKYNEFKTRIDRVLETRKRPHSCKYLSYMQVFLTCIHLENLMKIFGKIERY